MKRKRNLILLVFAVTITAGLIITEQTFSRIAENREPGLTIYNQNFAVVRQMVPLDLKKGINNITFIETTAHLEPDSVLLRDPSGKIALEIREQNYRADPVSQELLLSLYEGKTIDFQIQRGESIEIVKGKIIRSAYVPHQQAWQRYGQQYYAAQQMFVAGSSGQPIIEMNGQLRFGLPGTPLFPNLTNDSILKPTIHWLIETDQAAKLGAELSYITGGMSWEADYNMVAPERGSSLEVAGWVTIDNQSGKFFENARIQLVAGDVSKIMKDIANYRYSMDEFSGGVAGRIAAVTEKAFDEYHLYTLHRRTTLHDRETKQVEFVRASDVKSESIYVYDGAKIDARYQNYPDSSIRQDREYGTLSNPKVWVMREIKNTDSNHLGMPLPKGRVRFYRRDENDQLQFTGENVIDHTPTDEMLRVYTGNAFDLVGERKQTKYEMDSSNRWVDESFEIRLRNHKKESIEIRVVEHLYRWVNWDIKAKSNEFLKTDGRTIEFRVLLKPNEEKVLTYTVHYSW